MKWVKNVPVFQEDGEPSKTIEPTGAVVDARLEHIVRWAINNLAQFVMNHPGIRSGARIDAVLASMKGKPFLEFEEEDYRLLLEALKDPKSIHGQPISYPTNPARAALPVIEAFEQAKSEAPKLTAEPSASDAPS